MHPDKKPQLEQVSSPSSNTRHPALATAVSGTDFPPVLNPKAQKLGLLVPRSVVLIYLFCFFPFQAKVFVVCQATGVQEHLGIVSAEVPIFKLLWDTFVPLSLYCHMKGSSPTPERLIN